MFPISTSYCAARRLVVEGGGEIDSAAWPITWNRIAKGWGLLPYDFWPLRPGVPGNVPAHEPRNADEVAKRHRLVHYQRLRSEPECIYALANRESARIALEITKAWRDPPSGRIEINNGAPIAVHSILPNEIDFDRNCFVFQNSWGREWGDNGVGYLPFGYLSQFMVEGWTIQQPAPRSIQPGIKLSVWGGVESTLGAPWLADIQDGDNDVMIGWAHAVRRSASFDVEELFIRPDYRGRGYGFDLVNRIKQAVPESLPIRFWIPWGDQCDANAPALLAWAKKAGLRLEPSGVRWAAYRATAGAPSASLPKLAWIPAKASSPLEALCEPDQEVAGDDSCDWDAEKANRRAELVEKKYRGALSQEEMAEFRALQEEFGRYQDLVAPLPHG